MRELFSIMEGAGDGYNKGFSRIVRPSVRGIIICGKKLVLGYSTGCGAYEIPGGGIEAGETHFEALRREIREELGISIADNTITEFGAVHRIAYNSTRMEIFDQMNYYYICEAAQSSSEIEAMQGHEAEPGFQLRIAEPQMAVAKNRSRLNAEDIIVQRDTRVMELLIEEGYFPARL